ncbi:type II toxin-antitoxin system RelE/ParE family toxin [Rhizobium sp. RAF56]|uniref:type II toxin-antitoxin system RelE/ParE family toxin n=1 Tax=Rhizobium sp. RAF56 TaxID=3233062 RepID=UPI003F9A363B
MELVWRETALRDLERVIAFIADRNAIAARDQLARIEDQVQRLIAHPHSGRIGRVEGTRELVVSHTPFVVIYLLTDAVELVRVLHGAQAWPPQS